jgi:hypothetical protein
LGNYTTRLRVRSLIEKKFGGFPKATGCTANNERSGHTWLNDFVADSDRFEYVLFLLTHLVV